MKIRTWLFAALWAVFLCLPAAAQVTASRAVSTTAVTVGATPVTASGAHPRQFLAIFNQSTTATIYCTMDGSSPVASATANQLTFVPLSGIMFSTGIIPSNTVTCIASGAGTPVTMVE